MIYWNLVHQRFYFLIFEGAEYLHIWGPTILARSHRSTSKQKKYGHLIVCPKQVHTMCFFIMISKCIIYDAEKQNLHFSHRALRLTSNTKKLKMISIATLYYQFAMRISMAANVRYLNAHLIIRVPLIPYYDLHQVTKEGFVQKNSFYDWLWVRLCPAVHLSKVLMNCW
jgi:hypothetical protein